MGDEITNPSSMRMIVCMIQTHTVYMNMNKGQNPMSIVRYRIFWWRPLWFFPDHFIWNL